MAFTLEEYATAIQQLDSLRDTFGALDKEAVQLESKKGDQDALFELRALDEAMRQITGSVNDVLREFNLKVDFGNWPADSDAAKDFF